MPLITEIGSDMLTSPSRSGKVGQSKLMLNLCLGPSITSRISPTVSPPTVQSTLIWLDKGRPMTAKHIQSSAPSSCPSSWENSKPFNRRSIQWGGPSNMLHIEQWCIEQTQLPHLVWLEVYDIYNTFISKTLWTFHPSEYTLVSECISYCSPILPTLSQILDFSSWRVNSFTTPCEFKIIGLV